MSEHRTPAPATDDPRWEILLRVEARSLELFEMMGHLAREIAEVKHIVVELARARSGVRTDPPSPYRRATDGHGARRRLDSLIEIDDSDITAVRQLKDELARAKAVEDSDGRRLKRLAQILALILALAAVAGIVWGIFRYAVAHAA